MGYTVVSAIAEGVLERLSSPDLLEISLEWGVGKELKKFKDTLSTIKAVLFDAEEQQQEDGAVRCWLEQLKDVCYDADDLLDEFFTETLRQRVEIQRGKLIGVRNFFSRSNPLAIRYKIGLRMKVIRERLDNIASDGKNFHLAVKTVNLRTENIVREQTHSFVSASEVIGRNNDKEKIVKILLSSGDSEVLSVIPIVGIGGIGKTTLAKLVYNDINVIQCFEIRMWVCVSQDFKLRKVIQEIIKSATGAHFDELNLDRLVMCLHEILNAKKFLLVLDDVWNTDPICWSEFRAFLTCGDNGSTIIATTRGEETASIMGTVPSYYLSRLPNEDCLSLLIQLAFKEGSPNVYPRLVEVGKEIVDKCHGIPLAVKTLGSLLCMQTDLHQWLYIRDSDFWELEQENPILPALKISYGQLPTCLKQCFAYCSIFPQNYVFVKETMIHHWMAQGFLPSSDRTQQLEEIGNEYFHVLMSRSFFQEVEEDFDSTMIACTMHGIVHDLALMVAGTEFVNMNFNSVLISSGLRHVSFADYEFFEKEFPTSLLEAKKLRSFSFSCKAGLISESFLDTLTMCFRSLKLLDLSGSEFKVLPSFVGKLMQLRYLSLAGNHSLKALPNSMCNLLNLQTLNLFDCDQLQTLPKDIGKLISLRHLYLTSQLICLPEEGLQCLTSLRSLDLHRCNRLSSLSLGFQHLTSLRTLRIQECWSLASLPSGMKHLTAIEELKISYCQELNLLEGQGFQGLRSLRSLFISGLPKLVAFPQGLKQSAATLQYLAIVDCPALTTLPEWLEDLTSLLRLRIINCPNLLSLPEGVHRLISLGELTIKGCPHLSRRCKKETGEDWPKISHIPEIYIVLDED